MALHAVARLRNTRALQLRTPTHVTQDTHKAFACGCATNASTDEGNHLILKLENPVLCSKNNVAHVMEDAVQLERSEDSQFKAFMKGRSIWRLGHSAVTAGQGSAIRPEAGIAAKSAMPSLPRRVQVSYRAEYLAAGSFSVLRFHSVAFSTQRGKQETTRRDLAAQDEDPFDPLTDRIPEKPVTFAEGASYSVAIFAGFAVAAAAAYAVFKELIFEPKEYKVFNKALDRVQNDNQVTVRIGLPVTGYGQDSRNRAARQRIPHRTWADEDGVERIEVQFYVRGPHGVGRVHSEMFKDKEDKQWKFTYLIVDILSPSPTRLMLESYVPT